MNLISIIKKYRKSIFNVGIYFTAAFIPMILQLLINPLIALNMEPEDYAIVGYYTSFNSLLTPLITFYAFNYYAKRYFEVSEEERIILKATILKALIFLSMLLAGLSFLFIYVYMHFFNKQTATPFMPYAFLSIFTLPLTGILTFKLTDYKMQKKSKAFFKLSVSKGAIAAFLSILLVVVFKLGAFGKMSATFGVSLILFLFLIYQEVGLFKKKIDWIVFKSMLKFVWPLIIGAMLHFFTQGYDKVYLERLGNQGELGYYVVAAQIVGYIGVFRMAISNTFQPDIYRAIVNKDWRGASKYIGVVLASTLLIVLLFIILAPFVIDLLTAGRYTYSAKYARILAFSQITATMYFVITEITIVLGYTGLALINKIVGVILTIGLYWFFITNWQFVGAAWGQVTSYVVLMLVNIVFLVLWHKRVNRKREIV